MDALGGFERAFEMARTRTGIGKDEGVEIERFPRVRRSFWQGVLEGLFEDGAYSARGVPALPPVLQALIAAARLRMGGAMALMPYSIEVR